ncbi:MAG: DUF1573 domain-containing protein, partial [Cytophagaceae bacterium]
MTHGNFGDVTSKDTSNKAMFNSLSLSKACLIAAAFVLTPGTVRAQENSARSCGINSVVALGRLLNSQKASVTDLQEHYPNATISLLDVKHMGQQMGFETEGVKAEFQELLDGNTPCIIGMKNPDHFTVLLDGGAESVRIMDGEVVMPRIIPRRDIEARFTGYALVPAVKSDNNAPRLQMTTFDQYAVFKGIGQKVDYRFPVRNTGKSPLIVQIASTSCGCTAAVFQGKDAKNVTLAPQEQSEVVVSYNVQSQVAVQQMATIKTNDPHHPTVYLSIRGQLPPQLALSPPAIYVDQDSGQEPEKTFQVIGPKNTRVERVWSDLPYLRLHQGTEEIDGERVRWPVSVNGFAVAPIGPINGKIFVHLADGQEIFLQVRGVIEGQLPGVAQAALLPRAEDDHQTPTGSPLPTLKIGQVTPDFVVQDANGKA